MDLTDELREAGAAGTPVRFVGSGSKMSWGVPHNGEVTYISTEGHNRLIEHNEGDLTAIVDAGLPLAEAQRAFAEHNQEFLLDPPDPSGAATIGGVIASGDSGPLRTRYGGPRDLVLGVQVALSDGQTARAGGKVIKNVAGYDLSKLMTGSLGSLGLLLELSLRLHPKPAATATAAGGTNDPAVLQSALLALIKAPLEARCLDVRFGGGDGALLARFGGATPQTGAERAASLMREAGLEVSVIEDDDEVWARQRDGQRSSEAMAVRVSTLSSRFGDLFAFCERSGGRMVGRAGLGLAWVTLDDTTALPELRAAMDPGPCAVLDAPEPVADPWPRPAAGPLNLMERVKQRFDPAGVCRPELA